MPFLENLETSIADNDGMPNNEKVINSGLALKVFQEEVCDHCSCKPVNDLLETQTSFEE
jgi:hypothetical protein